MAAIKNGQYKLKLKISLNLVVFSFVAGLYVDYVSDKGHFVISGNGCLQDGQQDDS